MATIKFNYEKNGIEIYFTSKPSEAIRTRLKANSFRWSGYSKCWYNRDSEAARIFAATLGELPTPDPKQQQKREEEQEAQNVRAYIQAQENAYFDNFIQNDNPQWN